MGFRHHRSVKIFPGVKINFNKTGHSITIGGKYAHTTINKKRGTVTQSYNVPIKGLSYSETTKLNTKTDTKTTVKKKTKPHKTVSHPASSKTYKICGCIALCIGIPIALLGLLTIAVGGFVLLVLSAILIVVGLKYIKISKQLNNSNFIN